VLDVDAWQLSGLQPQTQYEVQVRLANANGWGPWEGVLATTKREGEEEEDTGPQASGLAAMGM
jgi:hypothetical protein